MYQPSRFRLTSRIFPGHCSTVQCVFAVNSRSSSQATGCSRPSLAWQWVTSSSSHVLSVFGTRQRVNARALEPTSYGPLECAHRQAVPAQRGDPALSEEFRDFFLPRKDVRNGEIVFTESAPQPFPG